jgi:hypothetical protein
MQSEFIELASYGFARGECCYTLQIHPRSSGDFTACGCTTRQFDAQSVDVGRRLSFSNLARIDRIHVVQDSDDAACADHLVRDPLSDIYHLLSLASRLAKAAASRSDDRASIRQFFDTFASSDQQILNRLIPPRRTGVCAGRSGGRTRAQRCGGD